jgi:precorrin-6B methylase 2
MELFNKLKFLFQHTTEIRIILANFYQGNFPPPGWVKSFRTHSGFNGNGDPIPWYTYPAISFLENRIDKNMEIFEFGCGNSTLWWAAKGKSVIAIEHDQNWVIKMKERLPTNAKIEFCELTTNGEYCRKTTEYTNKFDIILVDGRDRVNCIKNCMQALKPGGVIILDDSHREEYQPAFRFLEENEFRHIDFSGLRPVYLSESTTTVFYRPTNILTI